MNKLTFSPDVLKIQPYIPGKPIEVVARDIGIHPKKIIKLASNENPLGPSKKAIYALSKTAYQIHMYPGDREWDLKKALAKYVGVKQENLIFGSGSQEIIGHIATAFLRGGKTAIASKGSFIMYKLFTAYSGGKLIEPSLKKGYRHDLDTIAKLAKQKKARVVFLDNPMNPEGSIFTEKEMKKFMKLIPDSTLVVFDEAYFEYAKSDPSYPKTLKYILDGRRNVIILRTFSKIFGLAGLRFGYGIGHPEVINYLERVKMPFNVNLPATEAAYAALKDKEHLKKTQQLNKKSLQYYYKELDTMKLSYCPSHGNFVFVDTGKSGKEVFEAMQKEGVIVRPMVGYGFPNHIRISTGTMEQSKKCMAILKKYLMAG